MAKINFAIFMAIFMSHIAYTDTINTETVSVQRLYLQYKVKGCSYDYTHHVFKITRKPYYGFIPDYAETRVNYFGQNIAKEMNQVPEAKKLMNGYKIHGIGTISCIAAGFGIVAASVITAICKGSEKKPDGTYETRMPAGIPIGLGILGIGIVIRETKPIYLRAAVNKYNKYATRHGPRE